MGFPILKAWVRNQAFQCHDSIKIFLELPKSRPLDRLQAGHTPENNLTPDSVIFRLELAAPVIRARARPPAFPLHVSRILVPGYEYILEDRGLKTTLTLFWVIELALRALSFPTTHKYLLLALLLCIYKSGLLLISVFGILHHY